VNTPPAVQFSAKSAPAERTDPAVLAEFIARVLRQCPRATHVISAVILNSAIAHARVSHN
jgi:hypothetical protein